MVPNMPLSISYDDDRQAILHGGRKLLAIHQEIAVAGKADDGPLRKDTGRAYRRGQAEAHRAGGGPDLLLDPTEAQKAADPDGKIAGAVGEDRVGHEAPQREHDFGELNATRVRRRLLAPGQIVEPRLTCLRRPRNQRSAAARLRAPRRTPETWR